MTDKDFNPTTDAGDLEEVEVRPRAKRDAIISVRLSPREASALGTLASRAGMSVSELTRTVLRNAIATQWRVQVWGHAGLVSYPHETGGDFTRMFAIGTRSQGRVHWCTAEMERFTAVR